MKEFKLILLSLMLGALLSGCGPGIAPGSNEHIVEQAPLGFGSSNVSIVVFADGTRCAVYSGLKKGGIDCDWK